ncbi:Globulin-1 S allele [Zea mays]|uniref:Globulin-1 S allele n=1 Tax=Zea mays TaxID=4577 RepID=A0A1D6KYZ6_MAIZE|nr:Globulin-1 S allele [Zea mays]
MVSARIVVLLATLLCAAAAVASSWEDDNHHHHGGHKSGQCVRRCEDRPWHQRPRCLEQCREEEREKRQERSRHEADDRSGEGSSEDEREQEKEKQKDRRPYVFDRRSFRRVVRSEQGSLRVLRPFDEVSRLLRRPRPALAPAAVRRVARPLQPPGPAAQHRQPARAGGGRAGVPHHPGAAVTGHGVRGARGPPVRRGGVPGQQPPDRVLRGPRRQEREGVPGRRRQRAAEARPGRQGAVIRLQGGGGGRGARLAAREGVPSWPQGERRPRGAGARGGGGTRRTPRRPWGEGTPRT